MSLFTTQGYFTLVLETGVTITAATVSKILYKDPEGTTGFFDADISGTTALSYQFDNTEITVPGDWEFQAYVEIGGLRAYGDKVYQRVIESLPNT